MAKSSSLKNTSFFLRKHRRWPHTPYKAKWHRIFNQQQAMQALKQASRTPPQLSPLQNHQQETPNKPYLLSSLINSFNMYNCEPTPHAYNFLLRTLTNNSQFHHIPSVLDHLEKVENFEAPESIFANLIQIYGNANQLQNAIELFYRIPKFRCVPTVHSLNALLSVLCKSSEGLKLVPEILSKSRVMNVRIEESTFSVLIDALCRIKKVGFAVELLNGMISDGFSVDSNTFSLLLSSFCEQKHVSGVDVLGFLGELRKLGFCPGMFDYSKVISFLTKQKMGTDALHVLNQMKLDGIKPDIVCYTMVLNVVIENGDYIKADELFDELLVFGVVPDVCTYNVYISGLCKQNNVNAGIHMVACMEELGCKPNLVTYNTLVDGLCQNGELSKARELLREMRSKGIGLNMETYRAMIDALSANGEIIEPCALLEEVLDKDLCAHDSVFNEIICGLCQKGLICKALELLEKMVDKNVSPSVGVWESLLLAYGSKLNIMETKFMGLVDTKQTLPSCKTVNVEQ